MINKIKCVFYFAYFGTDADEDETIKNRVDYIRNQLLYLSNLCEENDINIRFIIAIIPDRYYKELLKIAGETNFFIYSKYIQHKQL